MMETEEGDTEKHAKNIQNDADNQIFVLSQIRKKQLCTFRNAPFVACSENPQQQLPATADASKIVDFTFKHLNFLCYHAK